MLGTVREGQRPRRVRRDLIPPRRSNRLLLMRIRVPRILAGKAFVACLVLALLLAQGLRLCLHVLDPANAGHAHSAALHLETGFNADRDADDTSKNTHVSLAFTLFKQIADDALAVTLVAAIIALFLFYPSPPWYRPARSLPPPGRGQRRRPPLRAPPL